MYNCFIFDLDGVLVDTAFIQSSSLICAIEKIAHVTLKNIQDIEVAESGVSSIDKLIHFANEGYFSQDLIDNIYSEKKKIADQQMLSLNPHDSLDKLEALRYLRGRNKIISIVTNANKSSTIKLLEHIKILPLVHILVTNNDVAHTKPHSEPYFRAMLESGCDFEKFIIFEDSEVGLKSARGTGVRTVEIANATIINRDFISGFVEEC